MYKIFSDKIKCKNNCLTEVFNKLWNAVKKGEEK